MHKTNACYIHTFKYLDSTHTYMHMQIQAHN